MLPFYRPYYDARELLAAFHPGVRRCEFELDLATRARAPYALTFAYGRLGFVAALKALGLTQGEVILPAYTCIVMAHAVMASGNCPKFVDISLTDYNMNVAYVQEAITPQTRAIVVPHMYGYLADVQAIRELIADQHILIVEDAALALHPLTSQASMHGDIGLFSFGAGKPISTYEGGGLVIYDKNHYEQIKTYRDQYLSRKSPKALAKRWMRFLASYVLFQPAVYNRWYQHRVRSSPDAPLEFSLAPDYMPADFDIRYPNFQARIGLAQLRKVETIFKKRRALAQGYHQELQGLKNLHLPPLLDDATYAYYTVRVPPAQRSLMCQCLIKKGIAVDQSYNYALPSLRQYHAFAQGPYPQATQAAQEVINLPCYPHLTQTHIHQISAAVRECIKSF